METRYHIDELAKVAGISRRTIHFYVTRGLMPRAHGAGRNGYYTNEHLDRLLRIRELRSKMVPIDEIDSILKEEDATGVTPASAVFEEKRTEPPSSTGAVSNMVMVRIHGQVSLLVPDNIWHTKRAALERAVRLMREEIVNNL